MEETVDFRGASALADESPTAHIDLTGVDPARWPEIRRRVAILDEYVRIKRPSREIRRSFAERIGLSGSQFMHLARAWRITRDASAIPGARSRISKSKPRRMPAKSVEVAQAVVDELGPLARRKDVLAEIAVRCQGEGTATPSDSSVANMMAAARAVMAGRVGTKAEILIDECTVRLPVAREGTVVQPRLLLAMVLPERRIVATAVSFEPTATPPLAELMAALTAAATAGGQPLCIRAPHLDRRCRAAIGAIALDAGRHRPTLGRLLGNRIGELDVIVQASKARHGESLIAARHASALGTEDAATAIVAAVAAHNARAGPLPASGFTVENARAAAR